MEKNKEVAVSSAPANTTPPHHRDINGSGEEGSSDHSRNPPLPVARSRSGNASSKYDFVKVKVWLGENADHYYVLSRFLLSRMLTVTKIPNHVALNIALELKKILVDNSLLDVSQSDLEANLFKLMEQQGYGEDYINRFKMMTRFHHQRVPLVILVCGTACVGKSTIATQLAQRLNLPNVLQTDMVYELLRTSTDAPLVSTPVWARDFRSSEELITEFCRECRIVRKGLAGDLKKAIKDGKPIIIEGIHLDPSIYLMDEENKFPAGTPDKKKEASPASEASSDNNRCKKEENSSSTCRSHNLNNNEPVGHVTLEEVNSVDLVALNQESIDVTGTNPTPEKKGQTVKIPEKESNRSVQKDKSGPEPIIIPLVLKMAKFDHKALLEEWISSRSFVDKFPIQEKDRLISNLKTIQEYLCSFKSQGLTVVNISPTTFPQKLDWLHGYLLQCIEQDIQLESKEAGREPADNSSCGS